MKNIVVVSLYSVLLCVLLRTSISFAVDFITPIPDSLPHNAKQAALGSRLYHDPRLSVTGTISCASCHNLSNYGVDSVAKSTGVQGKLGKRNSPTTFNAALNFSQFWDGRAETLQHQAAVPLLDDTEMGFKTFDDVVKAIRNIPEYVTLFDRHYSGEISQQTITHAISEFQKTLLAPNSPFDQYLKGNKKAISEQAKQGYQKFVKFGCVGCHQGTNVGGNMYQKFGVHVDAGLRTIDNDLGRYHITKNEWDKRVFKVPSLRFAVYTAPYFHDGSVATLEEAIDIMIRYQLGRDVPSKDRDLIIEFLKTLPGDTSGAAK